jgi:hypothetical protein
MDRSAFFVRRAHLWIDRTTQYSTTSVYVHSHFTPLPLYALKVPYHEGLMGHGSQRNQENVGLCPVLKLVRRNGNEAVIWHFNSAGHSCFGFDMYARCLRTWYYIRYGAFPTTVSSSNRSCTGYVSFDENRAMAKRTCWIVVPLAVVLFQAAADQFVIAAGGANGTDATIAAAGNRPGPQSGLGSNNEAPAKDHRGNAFASPGTRDVRAQDAAAAADLAPVATSAAFQPRVTVAEGLPSTHGIASISYPGTLHSESSHDSACFARSADWRTSDLSSSALNPVYGKAMVCVLRRESSFLSLLRAVSCRGCCRLLRWTTTNRRERVVRRGSHHVGNGPRWLHAGSAPLPERRAVAAPYQQPYGTHPRSRSALLRHDGRESGRTR